MIFLSFQKYNFPNLPFLDFKTCLIIRISSESLYSYVSKLFITWMIKALLIFIKTCTTLLTLIGSLRNIQLIMRMLSKYWATRSKICYSSLLIFLI